MTEDHVFVRARVPVYTKPDYPPYGVAQIGEAFVPVNLQGERVVDCFTSTPDSISAYASLDAAWEAIKAMCVTP